MHENNLSVARWMGRLRTGSSWRPTQRQASMCWGPGHVQTQEAAALKSFLQNRDPLGANTGQTRQVLRMGMQRPDKGE